jgi:hypothetical protein
MRQSQKGSIMVYTLIILTFLLIFSFSIISVNESQTRSAIATDESVVAFFLAESGVETLLDSIYSGAANGAALQSIYSSASCSSGTLSFNLSAGTWQASFYDLSGTKLTSCSDTTWRGVVDEMKVDGIHAGSIRSIRMSVKPAP